MAIERIAQVGGRAIPLRGDNIDTDRIIPARFLRAITFEGLETHLFEDDRTQLEAAGRHHPVWDPRFEGASVLLVNANFGCGSSREHAPQAIRRRGIRAIAGASYSEIFFGNSVAIGLPCVTVAAPELEALMSAVEQDPSIDVRLDLEQMVITAAGVKSAVTLPPGARESFLEGSWDATGLLLERFDEVEATAARLPYMQWS